VYAHTIIIQSHYNRIVFCNLSHTYLHKHRSMENSQWYKNLSVYYYPWNHFSLKVGVPDEIFDFKAEGIFYYIIITAHIAVMESRGVDLRFEPNSIMLYRYSLSNARDKRICVDIELYVMYVPVYFLNVCLKSNK